MPPRDPEPGGVVHRAATWNLRVGRNPATVAREVDEFLTTHDLDWLVVQEASRYVNRLAKRLRGRYDVHTGAGSVSRRDSAVIVRRGVQSRHKRVHRLEPKGWERGKGRPGLHHNRSAVSVRIGRKGRRYRVVSVHIPPGPHNDHWPLRKKAAARSFATLTRLARRWSGNPRLVGWVMAGDWNRRRDDMGPFLFDVEGDLLGNGIDYPVAYGVALNDYRLVREGGSDHWPRVFTVRLP